MGVSKIELIIRMEKLTELKAALSKHGVAGMTVFPVLGCGAEKGTKEYEVDKNFVMELLPKCQVNLLVETEKVKEIVEFVKEELYTGHIGYGKIVVYRLDNVVRVRTGEEGAAAIKVFLAVVLGALGVYMALTQGVANEVNVGSLLSPSTWTAFPSSPSSSSICWDSRSSVRLPETWRIRRNRFQKQSSSAAPSSRRSSSWRCPSSSRRFR